jgi:hypothetical protein
LDISREKRDNEYVGKRVESLGIGGQKEKG